LPAAVVGIVLLGSGVALGIGALTVQDEVSTTEWVVVPLLMSVLAPAHVRVVLGPFGPGRMTSLPEGGHEVLEHTADVGIRAWGKSVEAVFEHAAWGLAEILGATANGANGEQHIVTASGADRDALLVDFLNELILLHETREAAFAGIEIVELSDTGLRAIARTVPLTDEPAGTGVKAATYHRLALLESERGYEAQVYLDV
jgi:SHS2 domain-containing protein